MWDGDDLEFVVERAEWCVRRTYTPVIASEGRDAVALFAVRRVRGPAWNRDLPLRAQALWDEHARFMNALAAEGFVVLGGPLDGTADVLLVMRAGSAEEIRARLADDPWSRMDLLRVSRVAPWSLRLGSLE